MGEYGIVLLVLQVIIVVTMIIVILLQPSASDGVSVFNSNNSMPGVMSAKGAANFLTKTTKYLAIAFIVNSLFMAYLVSNNDAKEASLADEIIQQQVGSQAEEKIEDINKEPEVPIAE
jgi:preprotein translocase subunit SecG